MVHEIYFYISFCYWFPPTIRRVLFSLLISAHEILNISQLGKMTYEVWVILQQIRNNRQICCFSCWLRLAKLSDWKFTMNRLIPALYMVKLHHISESTIWKFNYSDSFVLSATLIYKCECNKYEYNVNIELIPYEICLIHMPTHSDS